MKRNLKALVLVLLAAIATSAMATSMAQAEAPSNFWAISYPAHIDVTNAGEGVHTFSIAGLPAVTCTTASATGTLNAKSPELTAAEVKYEGCHVISFGITFPVHVDMNGCDYKLTAGTHTFSPTEEAGASDGSLHVECPGGKPITLTVFKVGSTTEVKCEYHIAAQAPKGTVTYNNEITENRMAITVKADELEFSVTQTTIATHDSLCTNHEAKIAKYSGSFWARATAAAGYKDTTVLP